MDGDSRLDLLTGADNCCDREPGFYWFRREADGHYKAQPKVRVRVADYEFVMPRFRTVLADWDGDGRLDVLAALTGTSPRLYRSVGLWSPAGEVVAPRPVQGSPDNLYVQPCVVDWDRDGRLDLLVKNGEEIAWHRNIAEAGEPRLAEPQSLNLGSGERPFGLSTYDWDHDGWPDLVVGYFRRAPDGGGYYGLASAGVRVYPRRTRSTGPK